MLQFLIGIVVKRQYKIIEIMKRWRDAME